MNDFNVIYVVRSESPEKLRLARTLARGETQLDTLRTEIATAKDRVDVHTYRIDDYFKSVDVNGADPTSFRIVFAPRPQADSFWKDVVVKVLTAIKQSGALIQLDKKS